LDFAGVATKSKIQYKGGNLMDTPSFESRAIGCLMGLAIGDAMGAPVEGWSVGQIKEKYGRVEGFLRPDSVVTDDTEYAIMTAKLLLKFGPTITLQNIIDTWMEMIKEGELAGGGFSTSGAINHLREGVLPPACGRNKPDSYSDGAAMRIAPAGIVFAGNPKKAADFAALEAQITHGGEGVYGAQAVAAAVSSAMAGYGWEAAIEAALNAVPENSWIYRQIEKAVSIGTSCDCVFEAVDELHDKIGILHYFWTSMAPEAVPLALGVYAAAKGQFRDSILGGVNVGRDADTIAAIAGALGGATSGSESVPKQWWEKIRPATGKYVRKAKDLDVVELARALTALAEKEATS